MAYLLFGLTALFFSPVTALCSEIMFEGFYRIEMSGKHVGYSIQRYGFEPKSKTFESISFLRIKVGEDIIQRSLKARANDKFQPLSYQYTGQEGKNLKTIDATFKGEVMQLKINDGKKTRTENHKIPKGTFMTNLLQYVMLQKPMPVDQAFKYSGLAEEEGASYWGKAWLAAREERPGYSVFRVVNSFKGEQFISKLAVVADEKQKDKYVKAEVLGTSSPATGLTAELVAMPHLATEGQNLPNKILVSLFGGIPVGKLNLLANPGASATSKEN